MERSPRASTTKTISTSRSLLSLLRTSPQDHAPYLGVTLTPTLKWRPALDDIIAQARSDADLFLAANMGARPTLDFLSGTIIGRLRAKLAVPHVEYGYDFFSLSPSPKIAKVQLASSCVLCCINGNLQLGHILNVNILVLDFTFIKFILIDF